MNAYRSARARAWRNLIVATINAGLERALFSLEDGDNRWPAPVVDGRRDHYVFPFVLDGIGQALGCFSDIGYGELSIHAALLPTTDAARFLPAACAGFLAGDAVAEGWIERRRGAYLQASPSLFKCRKSLLPALALAHADPMGFGDSGRIIL